MKNTFALFVAKLAKWSFLLKRVSSPGCSAAHHIEFNTQNNDAIQPFASLLFSEDDQQSATTTQPATNKQDIKDSKGSQPETKENKLRSRPQPVATSPEWKRVNDDMACCTATANKNANSMNNNDTIRSFVSFFISPIATIFSHAAPAKKQSYNISLAKGFLKYCNNNTH